MVPKGFYILYSFEGGSDGSYPQASLIAAEGALYGTTSGFGSPISLGTVFSVTLGGVETVLHNFVAAPDGLIPQSPLVDLNGVLYGTTTYGGSANSVTVYSITRSTFVLGRVLI